MQDHVREFYTKDFLSTTLRKTKSDCKRRRDLEFSINLDHVLQLLEQQQGLCALTGWPLEFSRGGDYRGGKNPMGCTMDRIDNTLGYVPGNVQLVCCMANYVKSDMPLQDFRALCAAVAYHT
jgi:hypothetical protein